MRPEITILKDLMFGLVKQQSLTTLGSEEYKKRMETIRVLKGIIKKSEHKSLFSRIFTSKKHFS